MVYCSISDIFTKVKPLALEEQWNCALKDHNLSQCRHGTSVHCEILRIRVELQNYINRERDSKTENLRITLDNS